MTHRLAFGLCALLAGCRDYHPLPNGDTLPTPTVPHSDEGLVGDGLGNPYPSALLVDGNGKLDIARASLPSGGKTPLDVDRFSWRTGFSPAQTAVLRGVVIDSSGLPTANDPPGTGTVRMADLTAGAWLPCFAELDAYPNAEPPSLIVRPLVSLPDGHRIAVAITTDAMNRPPAFEGLMSGNPSEELLAYQPQHVIVINGLESLGLAKDDLALAWDFPVQHATQPLATALAGLIAPGTADLVVDATPRVPQAYQTAVGSFPSTTFLIDDRHLSTDGQGTAVANGTADAHVYVHIPASVADAPAGTVPVLFFGHGIFASPEFYLDDPSDENGVLALADELGAIVVGTNWRGLTTPDLFDTTSAASDFSRISEVTDRLLQAQVNLRTLMLGVQDGGILDDPDLHGLSGQVLFDPDTLYYYGISLGGIEGAVLWAEGGAPVQAAALHVGGAMWSTMLERSSNWPLFEGALVGVVPNPSDRQVLYSFSQLHWDPIDPMTWTDPLSNRPFLLQVSIGDEQVPNVTSEALARSVGLPLLSPSVTTPLDLNTPTGPQPRAFVQYDPEVALPESTNRPARVTHAHTIPRLFPGQRHQVATYLTTGQVEHFCGASPCSASNPGSP